MSGFYEKSNKSYAFDREAKLCDLDSAIEILKKIKDN